MTGFSSRHGHLNRLQVTQLTHQYHFRILPERPPEGERILWQGRPDWWALTWQALSLPWVAGYFAALAVWRFGSLIDAMPAGAALAAASPFLLLGAVVCLLLFLVGLVQARATVYTITNHRVAMRIGAALTELGFTASNGEAKRKLAEGAVKIDGETITDPGHLVTLGEGEQARLSLGKKKHAIIRA